MFHAFISCFSCLCQCPHTSYYQNQTLFKICYDIPILYNMRWHTYIKFICSALQTYDSLTGCICTGQSLCELNLAENFVIVLHASKHCMVLFWFYIWRSWNSASYGVNALFKLHYFISPFSYGLTYEHIISAAKLKLQVEYVNWRNFHNE